MNLAKSIKTSSLLFIVFITLHPRYVNSLETIGKQAHNENKKEPGPEPIQLEIKHLEEKVEIKPQVAPKPLTSSEDKHVENKENKTKTVYTENEENYKHESMLLTRVVMFLISVSLLFMLFVGYKTYRQRRRRNARIKKYGVRLQRSNIEMTPLPLDDDEEEDDTVFDLKNVPI